MLAWVCQLVCRHWNDMTMFDGARMFTRCPDCGRETPGWTIERVRTHGQ